MDKTNKPAREELFKNRDFSSIGVTYEKDDFLVVPSKNELDRLLRPPVAEKPIKQSRLKKKDKISRIKVKARFAAIKAGSKAKVKQTRQAFGASFIKSADQIIKSLDHSKNVLAPILTIFLLAFTFIRGAEAKNNLEGLSFSARSHMENSFDLIDKGDLAKALVEADLAKNDIGRLKLLMQSWGQDVVYLKLLPANNSSLVAQERLLDSAYTILNTVTMLNDKIIQASSSGVLTFDMTGDGIKSFNMAELEKVLAKVLDESGANLIKSRDGLVLAQKGLSGSFKSENENAIQLVDRTIKTLASADDLMNSAFPWLSGADGMPKNILILFQNNAELRGSGGFIGSFAVARFENGELKKIDFETNIYKLDKPFMAKTQISQPAELVPLNAPGWSLMNSNWAVDGPESFAKVSEFYNLETGQKADGVIAIDTTLFSELLKIVGPIEMPEFAKTITADNFLSDIEYEVEKGYFERQGGAAENEPKKILALMMPIFLNRLFDATADKEKLPRIIEALRNSLAQKHLLFYSINNGLQQKLDEMGYSGKVEHKLTDYLFVHNSNIGGMKSSLSVDESIKARINIDQNGLITDHLELKRDHNGTYEWPDGINKNLVRLLLPQGSNVTKFNPKAGNFRFYFDRSADPIYSMSEEAGKTKVEFWQNTEPGNESESVIDYTPNYRVDTSGDEFVYRLFVQKQPGTLSDDFELQINYPLHFRPVNVENFDFVNRKILIKDQINSDKEYSIRFEKLN